MPDSDYIYESKYLTLADNFSFAGAVWVFGLLPIDIQNNPTIFDLDDPIGLFCNSPIVGDY